MDGPGPADRASLGSVSLLSGRSTSPAAPSSVSGKGAPRAADRDRRAGQVLRSDSRRHRGGPISRCTATESLTEDERAAIIKLLCATIAVDPYPLSPRIRRLKAALAKLDPSSVPQERPKPAPIYKPSLLAQRKKARRLRDGRI